MIDSGRASRKKKSHQPPGYRPDFPGCCSGLALGALLLIEDGRYIDLARVHSGILQGRRVNADRRFDVSTRLLVPLALTLPSQVILSALQ